ncbi:hypothetical protein [Neptunomonas sp.]|uniref:hypothetical protein n=1 Tax=Neptunomonas sp. TaxID=1971898 RepID=UPI0035665CCA
MAENIEVERLKERIEQLQGESTRAQKALAQLKAALHDFAGQEDTQQGNREVQLAEHQRLLDQYMYRDRLLVQEFYFSIAATGLALNLVASGLLAELGAIVCLAMFLLNTGLWVHIGHLRIDRDLMWADARKVEADLDMNVMRSIYENGYAEGPKQRKLSGTNMMVRTVGAFSICWAVSLGYFIYKIDLAF